MKRLACILAGCLLCPCCIILSMGGGTLIWRRWNNDRTAEELAEAARCLAPAEAVELAAEIDNGGE